METTFLLQEVLQFLLGNEKVYEIRGIFKYYKIGDKNI
jgi:hypothetical protein